MKLFQRIGVAALLVAAAASSAGAADVKSGIPAGGKIGAYSTVKCAGIDDGVAEGKSLCYT